MTTTDEVLGLVPKACPFCKCLTVLNQDMTSLQCSNETCGAKLARRLELAAKDLGMKYFGPAVCESVVRYMPATPGVVLQAMARMGPSMMEVQLGLSEGIAKRVSQELVTRVSTPAEDFLCISATSPDTVGAETAKALLEAFGSIEGVLAATADQLVARLSGVGPKKAANIVDGIAKQANDIRVLREMLKPAVAKVKLSKNLTGMRICVTGEVPGHSREEVRLLVEVNDGIWATGVSKTTTLLVAEDPNSGTSKIKAAQKNGTKVISAEEFIKLCGGPLKKSDSIPLKALPEEAPEAEL